MVVVFSKYTSLEVLPCNARYYYGSCMIYTYVLYHVLLVWKKNHISNYKVGLFLTEICYFLKSLVIMHQVGCNVLLNFIALSYIKIKIIQSLLKIVIWFNDCWCYNLNETVNCAYASLTHPRYRLYRFIF